MPEQRPSIRVYVPSLKDVEPVLSILACCEDPTPGVEPREVAGHLTCQGLYCGNCDTDWMDFAWDTADVEAIVRAPVDDPAVDATVARHPAGKKLAERRSCDNQPVTAGAKFWSNDMRVVEIAVVDRNSNDYQGKATQTWHDTTDKGIFDTLDRDMQPYGRLVRYLDGKDAEKYPAGTNYADIT